MKQINTNLAQVDGEIDLVVLHAAGERRALPPGLHAVHGVLRRVLLHVIVRVAEVAHLGIDNKISVRRC